MTRVAIVNPTTLLGKELREGMDRRPDRWTDVRLLATDPDQVGTVTEVAGAAALVQPLEADSLEGVELAFFCGGHGREAQVRAGLAAEATAILLDSAATAAGEPVVAGVNLDGAPRRGVLVSPHPGVVALAHLLHPLAGLGPFDAVAVLVLPASVREQDGLEELFEQTRAILAFAGERPQAVFGRQLAFNLFPAPPASHALAGDLARLLGPAAAGRLALQTLQGGFFHSLAVSLFLSFERDPGAPAIRRALAAHPYVELAAEPAGPGPIDAAANERLLVGAVTAEPGRPGGYWLWAVMDNLTRGGATNALEIAAAILGF